MSFRERHRSPLRYPGGKSGFAPYLARLIELNDLNGCTYLEPFAGGAGAALQLLNDNFVSQIRLNDYDVRIFSFWSAILNHTAQFVDKVMAVPITISEWRVQHEICMAPQTADTFSLGFATFYMNRCNRSGVVVGAGPIGGFKQDSTWTIDARFNRPNLAERIMRVAALRDSIQITNMDALQFIRQYFSQPQRKHNSFVYLDPPYFAQGKRLYLNELTQTDHRDLAQFLQEDSNIHWVVSYDDSSYIADIYSDSNVLPMRTLYGSKGNQLANEFFIVPSHLEIPAMLRVSAS